ncbi:MAG: 2-oxo acid dehydrogenase subunit E2 [Fimbriimonadaceae bacterium]|nr:2-oxo acid dehydrogenase subunit E2 [Fimbriimonadaceae bacterium]
MAVVPVRIPQIGEGLQEARVVAFLKQPGDFVKRDEPIYQMETDKAVMDVESPFEGTIVKWLGAVDQVMPIGAEIGEMEVSSGAETDKVESSEKLGQSSPTSESLIALTIPQIGEGLQEARLVATLKNPGDPVKRDEAIYQMETDKAVMDVESPYQGVLTEWLVQVDTVVPIGAEIARMKVVGEIPAAPAHHEAPVPVEASGSAPAASPQGAGPRRLDVPPRTRAYAKEKGLSEADLANIPASGSKLMPADIDAFLARNTASAPTAKVSSSGWKHVERELTSAQRLLSSRLVRGSQLVVPGTITVATVWEAIERARANVKASGGDFQPSAFTMFAYAVVQALKDHPGFRSTLAGDSSVRTYDHVHLGIAVALPGDQLVLAVVDEADQLTWPEFASKSREQIQLARDGKDQAHEAVTISLTNMQSFGLRDAVPVVVTPSVATIFLGEPYNGLDQSGPDLKLRRFVNLAMTFDHRLINGVGASEFLNQVRANTETIDHLVTS